MIIDMIIDICDDIKCGEKRLTVADVYEYVNGWYGSLNTVTLYNIRCGVETGDFRRFKAGCMAYMEQYGYRGSRAYNRFKRLSIKSLKNYFTN